MTATISQQPSESYLYDFDFTPKWRDGDTVAQVLEVKQETLEGTGQLVIGQPAFAGAVVQVRLSGAVDGGLYKVTVKALSAVTGDRSEIEGKIRGREE